MRAELRYRQIHLDFHTSEHIPEVGAAFDADQFVGALKAAHVNWINVFAKCHHGWSYYPTKLGAPHPNLARPDLLGEMVAACRKADITPVVYVSVQWDERVARLHPGWRVMDAANGPPAGDDPSASNQLTPRWHTLCLSNREYVDYVIGQALEVIDLYHPDGLWMDILGLRECVCPNCLAAMQKAGLDPGSRRDRLAHHRSLIMDYYRRCHSAVMAKDPGIRLFHNSGHVPKGERDRLAYFTHLELESLPTGGWGYDHFPISARYVATLGLEYLGMTGKFHTTWGEFGGYKKPVALEYECCLMAAMGARCNVGDQLHPSGRIDEATYRSIAPAFARIEAIEEYLPGSQPVSEVAIVSAEASEFASGQAEAGFSARGNHHDDGAARMLLELQVMFDVVDWQADLERYKLLVLPDTVTLDGARAARLERFVAGGGALILTGASGMSGDRKRYLLDAGAEYAGAMGEHQPDYIMAKPDLDGELPDSPFVVYERPYAIRARAGSAEVLAESRAPFFNRTWDHFCSHQHTPYRLERNAALDAVIQKGSVITFAHPVFLAYYKSGQPLLKYLVRGALERLLPERQVRVELPSSGRMSFMEQPQAKRRLLHLLYAQTQPRGEESPRTGQRFEIIEDVVPVSGVRCSVRLPAKPKRVYLGASRAPVPFAYKDGRLELTVERLYVHEVVVIDE